MKPVLIQYLTRRNKGKSNATPTSREEGEHYSDSFAQFVLWFVAALVIMGLMLS